MFLLVKNSNQESDTEIAVKQYNLLRSIVEDAVAYVHQVSMSQDLTATEKKEMAMAIAHRAANKFDICKERLKIISNLIESVLWKENLSDEVDDTEYN